MATFPELLAEPEFLRDQRLLADTPHAGTPHAGTPAAVGDAAAERLYDSHGRVITDLRVSITDRCNYKCVYCRTGQVGAQFSELKTEDYLRLIRTFVALGIEKVRLTGGEPLLRRDLVDIVKELSGWRTVDGQPLDIAITTNGHLLESLAKPLKTAGLSRVTVSMDGVGKKHSSALPASPAALMPWFAAFAPPRTQVWAQSKSIASCCAVSMTTRSRDLLNLHAGKI